MKFRSEKKEAIVQYLLEKVAEGTQSLSKCVAETFGISQNTVHIYLRELQQNKVIEKGKRGQYKLATKNFQYEFKRSLGDLDSDTHAFQACMRQHIDTFAENVQHIWSYAFSEMVNNVMDHSEAENMRVFVTQDHLRTSALIIDDGVGIFEKIKNHFSLSSLDDAICELFKGKLTTDEQNHSGEGIFFTSKMMDAFVILSSGRVFATSKYENEAVMDGIQAMPGTCVIMSLSNFSHKQAGEIFDAYSNVDGSFSKTRIPLKNIFDAAPVSRSQAKRICHRLDKFQKVVLDFAGITWMGQGFAHQLFVLYQKEHPQIQLIPENMSEGVENMYNHVRETDGAQGVTNRGE